MMATPAQPPPDSSPPLSALVSQEAGSQNGHIRPHLRSCKLTIGFIRRGNLGSMFIRAGGWACPGCLDDRLASIAANLTSVVTTRLLWLGELDNSQRRASRQRAYCLPHAGRITAARHSAPALMLTEANLTPRSRALRPHTSLRAAVSFLEQLRDGPVVRRVDWDQSWRPAAETKSTDAGVRAGMGPLEMWEDAVKAAGFKPGHPIPAGTSDVEAAAAIEEELDRLRAGEEPDTDAWGRPTKPTPEDDEKPG